MIDAKNTMIREQRVNYRNSFHVAADASGFTLVELIMVVVLISILAVSFVPKFLDTSAISLEGGAAMVVADIRYTQELAMSTHAPKTITFTTNDTYYTVNSLTMNLPSRVTISSGATFTFNSLGEPIADCGSGSEVQITAGSGPPKIITVDCYTGRVSSS